MYLFIYLFIYFFFFLFIYLFIYVFTYLIILVLVDISIVAKNVPLAFVLMVFICRPSSSFMCMLYSHLLS